MGIVNVTPDSFSDGGKFYERDRAVEHAMTLIRDGAGIIDIGGESTRPGAEPVAEAEELRRVIPVIRELKKRSPVPISVDTTKTAVAAAAIENGAEIINDIDAATAPGMVELLRKTNAAVCVMHKQGTPQTMQLNPVYDDVVEEVFGFLTNRRNELIEDGILPSRIAIDPGLGFGKTAEHHWEIVTKMNRFLAMDAPLLVGHSRKRFIAERFTDRDEGTHLVTKMLAAQGVQILRCHEVAER